ncbi:MAG: ABC transporter permease [Leptospiraceae bacterium]|nr:ABC transporter permease [Leptospiraceae bacterium]MDW8306097.1 ABC transporter permease subunit [Leptospiraceae bacterium]
MSFWFPVFELSRRDMGDFFRSMSTYVIFSFVIFLFGISAWYALKQQASIFRAVQFIFYVLSGAMMVSGVLLAMRLIAEERQEGTIELLLTFPINELQIVLGKFTAVKWILLFELALTLPISLSLVFLAKANLGQLLSGYLGALLIGLSAAAVTFFYSAWTRYQLLAALAGGANVIFFLLLGYFSPYIDPPLKQVLREFSFYVHFMNFEKGVISLPDVVFYISIISFYLFLTRLALESRRLA